MHERTKKSVKKNEHFVWDRVCALMRHDHSVCFGSFVMQTERAVKLCESGSMPTKECLTGFFWIFRVLRLFMRRLEFSFFSTVVLSSSNSLFTRPHIIHFVLYFFFFCTERRRKNNHQTMKRKKIDLWVENSNCSSNP